MNAVQVIKFAKQSGQKGVFIKRFKNGQELRAYTVNGAVYEVRAYAAEHA